MMKPSKSQAKDRINKALDEIPALMPLRNSSPEFTKWKRNTRIAIINTFGQDTHHLQEFDHISFSPFLLEAEFFQRAHESGLTKATAILESMLEEIEDYWQDDDPKPYVNERASANELATKMRVFVIHGRDDGSKDMVARFLENLALETVILQEQPNQGRTIIEKFEQYTDVGFAVVLCTPDDVGALATEQDSLKPRPRQNVVLEWGFFLGRIGRERVCALVKGKVEIPSDYAGVVFIDLDESGGWKIHLARELSKAGLPVDVNRLL